ncbi:MAG: aldehyde dehydrogenase family protein [Gemmatimonadetes bacterium]|nr:aldehyde dehydrogenase family protein [Gemmatimonadota bacterium]
MDRDLESIQEARDLVTRSRAAQRVFASATQERVDRVIRAMGEAAERAAEPLARLAVDETRMGRYQDKILKNRFSAVDVRDYILPLKTCGIIREAAEARVKELAVPMGVVAALVPTTNPTSTAIYKALIAVKARNSVVFSPHPRATKCVVETVRVLGDALRSVGEPEDLVLSLTAPTLEATTELMRHRLTAVILATGGAPMVRAAYSSGKPAYGVGPGNVPAIVERTADVRKAVADIVAGKSFDNGLLCSAENSLICDRPVETEARAELQRQRALVVTGPDRERLRALMQDPKTGHVSSEVVGLSASEIARRAGIAAPAGTRVLVVECSAVGPNEFFSREKLSPVLALYIEDGWEKCCERAMELLNFGGVGHSLVIHSRDEHVIQRFFEEKPAFRILVNTMAAMGAVGYTTGLAPAMSLGPGTWAGSVTSDNITPLHLINVKRLAYELRPFVAADAPESGMAAQRQGIAPGSGAVMPPSRYAADDVARAVEAFLADRRFRKRA